MLKQRLKKVEQSNAQMEQRLTQLEQQNNGGMPAIGYPQQSQLPPQLHGQEHDARYAGPQPHRQYQESGYSYEASRPFNGEAAYEDWYEDEYEDELYTTSSYASAYPQNRRGGERGRASSRGRPGSAGRGRGRTTREGY